MPDRPPQVFTVPAGLPLLDLLADTLLDRFAGDPLGLAGATVLLPTRRACLALGEAFLRAADGRPVLLPQIRPIGDVDPEDMRADEEAAGGLDDGGLDLPPTMPALRRRLLLTRLVRALPLGPGEDPKPVDQAARLAQELARLLDRVATEGLSFDRLDGLAPDDYADHWRRVLTFLGIIRTAWPEIRAAEGAIDATERRDRAIRARAELWRKTPPAAPVIAAGSTGSIPATAELLAAVARLPDGTVLLPGFDPDLDDRDLQAILGAATHPQHGMARLIVDGFGLDPREVTVWPETTRRAGAAADRLPSEPAARRKLVRELMRPADTVAAWADGGALPEAEARIALSGVTQADCASPDEEAAVVALAMRAALEEPTKTAALVTPDRDLARRVAAALRRWGIDIDDSAGRPLAETPAGAFLRLAAAAAAEALAPIPLLALLKHPCAAGPDPDGARDFRKMTRRLEEAVLRGPRPAPGADGLRAALTAWRAENDGDGADLAAWLDALLETARPFLDVAGQAEAPFADLLDAHLAFCEALAGDGALLWAGDAGEELARFVAELRPAAAHGAMGTIPPARWPALLDTLMAGRAVRPRAAKHPRLAVLGPLEARLRHADLVILGGMNEGTWPAEPAPDPWMSREMRRDFGLPPEERRIGLAAHDVAQALCARDVLITRAARIGGAQTVPSRWLTRLDAVLRGVNAALPEEEDGLRIAGGAALRTAVGRLDDPPADLVVPSAADLAAGFAPPIAARPKTLSVTRIQTWMADPYQIHAMKILRLRPLDPIDQAPDAAERGALIHAALETFVRTWAGDPVADPEGARAALIDAGRQAFGPLIDRPGVHAFWWPRFLRIADWVLETERSRAADIAARHVETRGGLEVADGFVLTATADRIDRLRDGKLAIVDYKTGTPPTWAVVAAGRAPQLPLEALIAEAGRFEGVTAAEVSELAYWHLSGGPAGGEVKAPGARTPPIRDMIDAAADGLRALVARFDDPSTPYLPCPDPDRMPAFNDFRHLERLDEWAAAGGGGE